MRLFSYRKEVKNLIKILNQSLEPLALLINVVSPSVSEEINREFTASFQTIVDGDKSDEVTYQNIAEIENNYFNIVYTKDNHNADDTLTIDVECEHVSYDLLGDENDPADTMIVDYYADVGTPAVLLTTLLAGTGFTVGQVDFTALTTLAINEKVSKRGILLKLAEQLGGELKFDKYVISLLTRRGADNGLGFRYRRNLVSMSRITDNRNKVAGLPTVTYDTDVVELEYAQGHGVDDHYGLGDTVYLFDDQLGIVNLPVRIIKESHNPVQRMQGKVTISNLAGAFIKDINDTVTDLQQTTVSKDALYNGVKIGPDEGFVATRSDNKVKSVLNATEGISVQSGDGLGAWENRFYVDVDGNIHLKDSYIDIVKGLVEVLVDPTVGLKITNNGIDVFYVDVDGNIHLKDSYIDIVKGLVEVLVDPTVGLKITNNGIDVFYVDVDGNIHLKDFYIDIVKGLVEVLVDPTVGLKITNNGIDVFYDDVDGKVNLVDMIASGAIVGSTISGSSVTGTTVEAKDILKVSSNIWNAGTDYGMQFGGVVAGYVGPATIKYFQGLTGDGSTVLSISVPGGGQIEIDPGLAIYIGASQIATQA